MSDFYVYIWFNDDWGKIPIYVGKGRGNRFKSLTGRSSAFLSHIGRWKCHSEIVFDELDENRAMRFEKALKDGFIRGGYPILDAEAKYRGKVAQTEGIAAMPVVDGRKVSAKTGNPFGRPKARLDDAEIQKLVQKQKDGLITVEDCCRELGISRSTWYDRVRKVG